MRCVLFSLLVLTSLVACSSDSPDQPDNPDASVLDGGDAAAGDGAKDAAVSGFTISVEQQQLRVRRGQEISFDVSIVRSGPNRGEIELTADDLPAGVALDPVAVDRGISKATVTLRTAPSALAQGPLELTLKATSSDPLVDAADEAELSYYITDASGVLDTSFGDNGEVVLSLDEVGAPHVNGLVRDGMGRIVVCGTLVSKPNRGFVLRLNKGAYDETFAEDGKIIHFGGQRSECQDIAVDGQSLVASLRTNNGLEDAFFLRKLDTNGVVDRGFGLAGDATLAGSAKVAVRARDYLVAYSEDWASILKTGALNESFVNQSSDESFYAVRHVGESGRFYTEGSRTDVIDIARFESDGTSDISFGTQGMVELPLVPQGPGDELTTESAISRVYESKFGGTYIATQSNWGRYFENVGEIIRLTDSGALDTSFGIGGRLVISQRGFPSRVIERPDGSLLVFVFDYPEGGNDWRLRHYSRDGEEQTDFDTPRNLTESTYYYFPEEERIYVADEVNHVVLDPDIDTYKAKSDLRIRRYWLD